eukprot:509067_1
MAQQVETTVEANGDTYISCSDLYNIFQQPSFDLNYLIFDIAAARKEYNESHIISSIHLDCDALIDHKHNSKSIEHIEFKDLKTSRKLKAWTLSKKSIVMYDHKQATKCHDTDQKMNTEMPTCINIINELKSVFAKTTVSSLKILNASYHDFHSQYPYLCVVNETKSSKQKRSKEPVPYLPNEIIPKALYLTNKGRASKMEIMQWLNITHCVNVTVETPNFFEKNKQLNIKYLRIPVKDTSDAQILPYFEQTNGFIDNAIQSNGVVLVHCQMGKSRSATVVTAYVIHKYKYSAEEAVQYVKQRRFMANPNAAFMKQLKQFSCSLK